MHNSPSQFSRKLIELCNSYPQAVDAILKLSRILWNLTFEKDQITEGAIKQIALKEYLNTAFYSKLSKFFFDTLQEPDFREIDLSLSSDIQYFHYSVFQPLSFARVFLRNVKSDSDLKFLIMRNIRNEYMVNQTPDIAHLFVRLADAINLEHDLGQNSKFLLHQDRKWSYRDLFDHLIETLKEDRVSFREPEVLIEMFLECCRFVGYIRAHAKSRSIQFRTLRIDAEFLISNLFGLTTEIRGFDELFGGGGIILSEDLENSSEPNSQSIGRNGLIIGRFGTGKSMLCLQIAVEVARKGGLAWIMPLEQSEEECRYTLESISALPNDKSVSVATDIMGARHLLDNRVEGRGAIVILKTIKDSYDFLLDALKENALHSRKYPLRLLCVDPINSVGREDRASVTDLRKMTMDVIGQLKMSGTNVLIVAEEGDPDNQLLFEQNIADTVIGLSIDRQHEYDQRFIEIMKSRFQREQRGRHFFSIVPGEGIRISPSSAAVSARIRQRSPLPRGDIIAYGHHQLEDILGDNAINRGDIIVAHGPRGTHKVLLGLYFLTGVIEERTDHSKLEHCSLLVAARGDFNELQHMIENHHGKQELNRTRICELPHGYLNPGYIFQQLEEEIYKARLDGFHIARIMIDNIIHWDLSSPFVKSDLVFGDTLIDFLKRRGITSLINCGILPVDDNELILQKTILDRADCVLNLSHFEFQGKNRIMGRVTRTSDMNFDREPFEIKLVSNNVQISPISPLLRFDPNGFVKQVPIDLLMHSDTDIQYEYNKSFLLTLETMFSTNVRLESPRLISMHRALNLGHYSAVDHLSLLQLDEFQIPISRHNMDNELPVLHEFSSSHWVHFSDFLPRLKEKAQIGHNIVAVPFYENISLIAHTGNHFVDDIDSWDTLATMCVQWENKHDNPEDDEYLFFDFPKGSGENYNCLFFEILYDYSEPESSLASCSLQNWILSEEAEEAARIFRQLCRRSHNQSRHKLNLYDYKPIPADKNMRVDPNAQVWRHWYSTLNQMLKDMSPEQRDKIKISPLPKNFTTAGEWYLGIPAHSAASDTGLEIIKLLTSRESELDRMRLGVGLPVRSSFYDPNTNDIAEHINLSPYFSMDKSKISSLVANAFSRSAFGCYSKLSRSLTSHLQRIIEIQSETNLKEAIRKILKSLEAEIRFLQQDEVCSECPLKNRRPILRNS